MSLYATLATGLIGCAAAPALIPAAIEFARSLLTAANANYGGRYSEDMQRLMARLTQPYVVAAGLPPAPQYPPQMAGGPGQGAYGTGAQPGFPAHPGYAGGAVVAPYPSSQPYPSQPQPPVQPYPGGPPVPQQGGYPPQYPQAQVQAYPQTAYPQQHYPQQPAYPPQQGYPSQQAYPQQPAFPQQPAYPAQPQYGTQYPPGVYPRSVPQQPVAVDVALVRQVNTPQGRGVVLMNDGEVLRDNPADPQAGDKFKLILRTNCACYVYVVAIDGSGWAQGIFPTKTAQAANPVAPDREYALPEGANWFALDEVKGVETFYVVVSPQQRPDLEESIARVAGNERPKTRAVQQVEAPAVVPSGFAKTQPGHATVVRSEGGQAAKVTPLTYVAAQPGAAVTVTRWFKHE